MGSKPRVLFLCTGNACRSQMAEGWLRHLAGERVEALSAGTAPAGLNPDAAAVMAEAGVDVSGQRSESIELYLDDPPDLVISVCDAAARSCPSFPGSTQRLSWPFPDPASASGEREQVLEVFRETRDRIRDAIREWIEQGFAPLALER
jgi:arsenate reductase